MAPKVHSTRAATAASVPYVRRTSSQPKSTRQQFSACGACRMRRVRCDLKDLVPSPGAPASCSNCKERGLKCVDEFAEVKAVKLLRRGRRLQQVEAVYGKSADASASTSSLPTTIAPALKSQSIIPSLKPSFLESSFFRKFTLQRPILDPTEFTDRFLSWSKGNTSAFTPEAQLCSLLLVVWAASYGVDEYGVEQPDSRRRRAERKEKIDNMIREILSLIDANGILRKPTWDGVRALLLVLPLTEDIQPPMERQTMHDVTLSQVYTLCSVASPSSVRSGQGPYGDALIRARIFWYAHLQEAVTTGLRGGRLVLDNDDLISFQSTLPSLSNTTSPSSSSESSLPSPTSPTHSPFSAPTIASGHQSRASVAYLLTSQVFAVLLHLGSVCRRIYAVLTGPKSRQRDVDEETMSEIWTGLVRSWEEIEGIRRTNTGGIGVGILGASALQAEEVETFVSGWQIFIFECHNIIRESLKQRLSSQSSTPENSPRYSLVFRLHTHALRKCRSLLPHVLSILRQHLASPSSGLFSFDTSVVRDGCFFAGFLLAQGDFDTDEAETTLNNQDGEEGVQTCLRALGEMRWVFSKSEEREQTIRMVWEARRNRDAEARRSGLRSSSRRQSVREVHYSSDDQSTPYSQPQQQQQPPYPHKSLMMSSMSAPAAIHRPILPPLSMSTSPYRSLADSTPNTACTEDGSWPTYTPPTTSSTNRGSPPQNNHSPPSLNYLPPMQFKTESGSYYSDMDPFSFSAPLPLSSTMEAPSITASYHHHPGHRVHEQSRPGSHGGYLDPAVVFSTTPPSAFGGSDEDCAHFATDCNGFYH